MIFKKFVNSNGNDDRRRRRDFFLRRLYEVTPGRGKNVFSVPLKKKKPIRRRDLRIFYFSAFTVQFTVETSIEKFKKKNVSEWTLL